MHLKYQTFLLSVALTACGVGCTTLTVRRIKPDDTTTPGVRYALPKLFLQATPAADGGITVQEVNLPDSENMFAVEGNSYLATHTLNLQIENGLLKQVDWKPDGSAVLADGIAKADAVAAEMFKAKAETAKAEQTAISTARKTLADAELAVIKAGIKLDAIRNDPAATPAELRAAKIEYDQAVAARDAAKQALSGLEGKAEDGSSNVATGSANVATPANAPASPPAAAPSTAPSTGTGGPLAPSIPQPPGPGAAPAPAPAAAGASKVKVVPGSVLYVLEDSGTPTRPQLHLRAVGEYHIDPRSKLNVPDPQNPAQPSYRAPLGKAEKPDPVYFFPQGLKRFPLAPAERSLKIVPSIKLKHPGIVSITKVNPDNIHEPLPDAQATPRTAALDSPLEINVDLSNVAAGTYRVDISAISEASKPAEGKVYVRIGE